MTRRVSRAAFVFSVILIVGNSSARGDVPTHTVVKPGMTVQVYMSSKDNNRVSCPVKIRDVVYSREKGSGIGVKVVRKNAFIKFLVSEIGGKRIYATEPSEFFITCGDDVYSIIAVPKEIPAQTIVLSPGRKKRIEENMDIFAGIPFEKKVTKIIREAVTGDIPQTFDIQKYDRGFQVFRDLDVFLARIITVEGEGLRLKEYSISIRKSAGQEKIELKETDFLRKELAHRPVAVSLEQNSIKKGDVTRLFIVERMTQSGT